VESRDFVKQLKLLMCCFQQNTERVCGRRGRTVWFVDVHVVTFISNKFLTYTLSTLLVAKLFNIHVVTFITGNQQLNSFVGSGWSSHLQIGTC